MKGKSPDNVFEDNLKIMLTSAVSKPDSVFEDNLVESVLGEVQKERIKRERSAVLKIWRMIMKSRISKLAAAAAIAITIMLGIYTFVGDGTGTVFAQMTENMKKMPWVHGVVEGVYSGQEQRLEAWISIESQIYAGKEVAGTLTFTDKRARYTYDPRLETITISHIEGDPFAGFGGSSAFDLCEHILKLFDEAGGKVVQETCQYEGRDSKLYKISGLLGGMDMKVEMMVDSEKNLPVLISQKAFDSDGKLKAEANAYFDYPEDGPTSIYDLGVPYDAKIISNLPKEDYQIIWDNYRQSRTNATKEYIAVITHVEQSLHVDQSLGDIIMTVDVDYKSGRKQRWERHSVFKGGEQFDKFWPQYKEQLGDSFESLLAWTLRHYEEGKGSLSVYLYDGQYSRHARRKNAGDWKYYRKHYSPGAPGLPIGCLGDLGWPYVGAKGRIIEDNYSSQNNLVCIERLQQGSVDAGSVTLPARYLFYLDPERDYMCRRKVVEWHPDAEWQEDKNWLDGVEPQQIRDGSITVEDITEFNRAPDGRWYPKTIVVKTTGVRKDYAEALLKVTTIKTIYLRTAPQFADDIFDIARLSGE